MKTRQSKTIERVIAGEPRTSRVGILDGVIERARQLPTNERALVNVDWAALSLPRNIRCLLRERQVHHAAAWNGMSASIGRFEKVSSYVLLVALSGSGIVGAGENAFELREGETCLLPPGEIFFYLRLPDEFEWLTVTFDLEEESGSFLAPLLAAPREVTRKCRRLLNQFLVAFLDSSSAREALDVALAFREFFSSLREVEAVDPAPLEMTLAEKARAAMILDREGEVDLDSVAGKLGCSPAELKEKFELASPVSFAAFLRTVRLVHASHLLRETDESPEAIGRRCGFKSDEVFGQAFDDLFRCSPEQYRRLEIE